MPARSPRRGRAARLRWIELNAARVAAHTPEARRDAERELHSFEAVYPATRRYGATRTHGGRGGRRVAELPDDVPGSAFVLVPELRTCGRFTCEVCSGTRLAHGPFLYVYWPTNTGRGRAYIGRSIPRELRLRLRTAARRLRARR